MTRRQQRLVAVRVSAGGQPGKPAIVPLEGGTIEDLLVAWRVVQMQPLGPLSEGGAAGAFTTAPGGEASYVALLLLEESSDPDGLGKLGFGAG